jgi:hypothetical protein
VHYFRYSWKVYAFTIFLISEFKTLFK